MVKFTVWMDKGVKKCENTKFTRELNTYGFDVKGFEEELLFPIRLDVPSGGNQETNLANYLVKFMEFEKTYVKIKKIQDKEWFNRLIRLFNLFLFLILYLSLQIVAKLFSYGKKRPALKRKLCTESVSVC